MDIFMNMLLWSCDIQKKDFHTFEYVKNIGFDGVEFSLGSEQRKSYEDIGTFCDQIGLKRTAVCGAEPEVNAVSSDLNIRKASKLWIRERIDDVVSAGASNLGGPFHSVFNHFTGTPVTDDEILYSIEFLQEAGEYAAEQGVTLTPEFLNRYETYFGNTMEQAKELLDRVNHPSVLGMYDTYHANIEEKSQKEAIHTIAPYLSHVHISENDRGTPGKGQIDFDLVFQTLQKVGFKGTIAIEAFNRQNQVFADAVNVWRNYSPVEEILREGYDYTKSMVDQYLVSS